jgi:asparagine synthase (glutamine-hydrolysing)
MCGVLGWVDYERDLTGELVAIQAMTDTMSCRGPDDEGVWSGRHAALGHRRLAVIDPEGGRQPMTAAVGGRELAVLSYSGEVYDYRELRAELTGRGHRFRTKTDTEVVLHAYLEWGIGFAEHLNGMFALAVWDPRSEELLLVRDRMGIKPLFYFPTPHGLLFGSEPKAILANPEVPRRVGADGLREILDMVKTPEASVFTGMYEVRPGGIVRLSRRGLEKRTYWRLEAHEHADDQQTTIAMVRSLLEDTVARQLISDVPLCTLLSGGLDSSAVTAMAAAELARSGAGPVRSFSVEFASQAESFQADAIRGVPDAPYARELAAHVGAQHTQVEIDSMELADPQVRDAVLRAVDSPPAFWGDLWASLYLLLRAVRGSSTVALSGEGADELFGGYRWFSNPLAIRAETFPWLTSGSARYFGGLGLFDQGLLAKLDLPGTRQERYADALAEVPRLPGEAADERRMREMTHLNLTRFMPTLLDRKDRMSMAVGLEVRVPFCDHRLVEYVFNVPWRIKSFDGREKSLLRAATADLLPSSILQRVKAPYPATQDPAYEMALRLELADVAADPASPVTRLLAPEKVAKLVNRPLGEFSMPYDRGSLELALWFDRWLRGYGVTVEI